ncbi:MAG: hypothetical protein ABSD28_02605 [Tepidisphaeraceae bacterium]
MELFVKPSMPPGKILGTFNRTLLCQIEQTIPFDPGRFLLDRRFDGNAQWRVNRNFDSFIRFDDFSVEMASELNHGTPFAKILSCQTAQTK